MEIRKATDEFLFYLEIERIVLEHTLRSYTYDLHLFCTFLQNVHQTNELEYVQKKKAGLPPSQFSLHHLRHTIATLLLQQQADKVDIRTLQELLGHES